MNSPKIPAFHFNTRFLVTGESWFGGGADLTPTLSDKEAVDLFHNHMKDACSDYKKDAYEEYKKIVMNIFTWAIEQNLEELEDFL